jgi:hypothetical protein
MKYEDGCLLGCWPLSLVEVYRRPDDGGSKHLQNVCKLLPDYKAQQPRRQPSSSSGLLRRVVFWLCAHVSQEYNASIFMTEDGGTMPPPPKKKIVEHGQNATRRNRLRDHHLYSHCRENLNSYDLIRLQYTDQSGVSEIELTLFRRARNPWRYHKQYFWVQSRKL